MYLTLDSPNDTDTFAHAHHTHHATSKLLIYCVWRFGRFGHGCKARESLHRSVSACLFVCGQKRTYFLAYLLAYRCVWYVYLHRTHRCARLHTNVHMCFTGLEGNLLSRVADVGKFHPVKKRGPHTSRYEPTDVSRHRRAAKKKTLAPPTAEI